MSGRRPGLVIPLPANTNPTDQMDQHPLFHLSYRGTLHFPESEKIEFDVHKFKDFGPLGEGHFGEVRRMVYTPTQHTVAIKKIRIVSQDSELEGIRRDVDHMWSSRNSTYVVQFYGFTIHDGDCWICMEALTCSLNDFYPCMHANNHVIPEIVLIKITICVIKGLQFLKETCKIMHRDVKPANILLDRNNGWVKLCDFGISAKLVDSIAKTRGIGTQRYLSPERVKGEKYDIRADLWALGVSLIEVANGKFPFTFRSVMEQITQVAKGSELTFDNSNYSMEFRTFILQFTAHSQAQRPKYQDVMANPFFIQGSQTPFDLRDYFSTAMQLMPNLQS